MLFDGANRFLLQGAAAMRDGQLERSNERLSRAEAIIDELLSSSTSPPARSPRDCATSTCSAAAT